jgi:hypothetical protein
MIMKKRKMKRRGNTDEEGEREKVKMEDKKKIRKQIYVCHFLY